MTKYERVLAAIKNEDIDRVPYSVYMHSTVHERTVDKFVDFTLSFYKKYDPDYIKVMFDEHYDLSVVYDYATTIDIWNEVERLDVHVGAFGRQLEALKRIKDSVGDSVPVVQTIFLPFHFGVRFAYRRILEDLKCDSDLVLRSMNTIADNLVDFGMACIKEAGIDGFFYGAYGCESEWMTEDEYKTFVMPSDLRVIKNMPEVPVSILHIHGESETYFPLLIEYPVNAISWEDRTAGPSLQKAKAMTGKCLVGGVDHLQAQHCPADSVIAEARQAIEVTGGRGFILAPGCTFLPATPEENMHALKRAVNPIT